MYGGCPEPQTYLYQFRIVMRYFEVRYLICYQFTFTPAIRAIPENSVRGFSIQCAWVPELTQIEF